MPEATATKPVSVKVEQPDSLEQSGVKILSKQDMALHKGLQENLAQGGLGNHDTEAPINKSPDLPPHVPSGETKSDSHPESIRNEDTYEAARTPLSDLSSLSEGLNYADQIVTGRDHVVGTADRFSAEQTKRMEDARRYANQPKKGPGAVKRFVKWLHE